MAKEKTTNQQKTAQDKSAKPAPKQSKNFAVSKKDVSASLEEAPTNNNKIVTSTNKEAKKATNSKSFKKIVVLAGVLLVAGALGYFAQDYLLIASVNGKPITRFTLWQNLEKQYGAGVVDNMVTQELILQEGRKTNVTIADAEVDTEIKNISTNIEAQGTTIEQALAGQNMTLDDLKEQIVIQKTLEKLIADKAEVSDEELTQAVASLVEGGQEDTPELREQIKAELVSAKQSQEIQALLTALRESANVKVKTL